MSLDKDLRDVSLQWLSELSINSVNPFSGRREAEILVALCEKRIIDEAGIDKALEVAVAAQARRYLAFVTDQSRPSYERYPDHVGRPDIISYAIENGLYTPQEIRSIPFDHGEKVIDFCTTYSPENLIANLREEILHPKPLPVMNLSDSHVCCLH